MSEQQTATKTNGSGSDFDLALAKAKDEHGEVLVLTAAGLKVICRYPYDEEYERWRDECEKEKGKKPATATERIFRQTCLYPPKDQLERVMKNRRGAALTFGNTILEQYGVLDAAGVEKV